MFGGPPWSPKKAVLTTLESVEGLEAGEVWSLPRTTALIRAEPRGTRSPIATGRPSSSPMSPSASSKSVIPRQGQLATAACP